MSRGRQGLVLFLGAMLVMALSGGVAYADQSVKFDLTNFKIDPSSVTVRAGEKVVFEATNSSQSNHDVHIEGPGGVAFQIVEGATNHIPAGQSAKAEFTFTTPGTYQMWCPVGQHRAQGMEGTFTVTAAGAAAPARPAAPAQMPGALPRTGEPGFALMLGGLAAAGAGLVGAGMLLRRRKD